MRFCEWNVRSMHRTDSIMREAKEVSKYTLNLVGVQEVRWDRHGTESECEYIFFYGKGKENFESGTVFFFCVRHTCQSFKFVSDRMLHIRRRGRWSDIVLNVHGPTEDKIDDVKTDFTRH
jgi:hypothetical protein